jgi:hypothetical protein
MRIGERVREAHLSNHCPGGLGFPITSWHRAGTDADHAHAASSSWLAVEDHRARATGAVCARCQQVIAARQNVRCRGDGDWVHESCPPVPGPASR